MSSSELAAMAARAGFDLCGFARAEPLPPAFLAEWLEAGMAADMDWMGARMLDRLDVSRLLPGAQTVVALACNYFHPDPAQGSPLARYARTRDYHYTLGDRLRAFRRTLGERYPGVRTYGSVDAAPVMEKVWAARAGLGYVGRHGLLITERFGSYVLLAAVVMDAAVDAYAQGPSADRCGGCSLCISACPTDAIGPESVVDARRCISYQTIENRRGPVPEPLRPALADWVFGCDVCQDVCPLNRKPVLGGERFLPRAVAGVGVRELAAMTPEQYQAWVPGTPLARAKYDGLRRNAAYALGAARDAGGRDILERLATVPSVLVREAARWALGRLG